MSIREAFLIYLALVNFYGVAVMWVDKKRAEKHRYRISERHLWFVSLVFGSLGTCISMQLFHHKTNKPAFFIGFSLLCIVQIVAFCAIMMR